MRAGAILLAASVAAGGAARAAEKPAEHAFRLIEEWRIEEAEPLVAQLVKSRPRDSETAFLDGELLFLHGDYARAAERLKEAAPSAHPSALADEMRSLRDLAEATDKATRGFAEIRGEHFIVRYQPGKDALLAPYALEALERAYAALAEDFGERPPAPIRVEIYPEVADLAKVSTLTLKEIETSGTIALCKFNRLMITSPRALLAGYPWLDTLTHEYTHFIVSRVSHNTVPIWLHEGLAKFEEQRWRAEARGQSGARASGLTPTMEHLLASGLLRHHLITFEQMHPSMAKLPSQEDTALAFAEVEMAIEYLHQTVGWSGVRRVLALLRAGRSDAQAVGEVAGHSFGEFQRQWREWLKGRHLKLRPGLIPTELRFKKAPGKPTEASADDSAQIAEERARKFARLGGMMRLRRRLRAAAMEYEKAQSLVGPGNLQVAGKLARTYLELGEPDKAIACAEPALELYPDQAGPSATLGEAFLAKGQLEKARPHLEAAIAINPFDPALHCGLEKVYRAKGDRRAEREGKACAAGE